MYSKSDKVEIMMGFDNNEIIEKLFDSILKRYQEGLEVSVKGSDFILDYVESLNYIFDKIDLKRGGSYIETPEWIKKKKAIINIMNDNEKCFQYAILVGLCYDEMKNNQQRLTKVNKYVDKSDWSGINFPAGIPDGKGLNETINLLH